LISQKVIEIVSGTNDVEVVCANGTKHRGSIVLGADGTHSKTRRLMRELALAAKPEARWDGLEPFQTAYIATWIKFPRPSECGQAFETQHKDRGLVYFTSHDLGYVLMFEKLINSHEKRRTYNEENICAAAKRFADFPVTETLKVKDVFSNRLAAGMVNLDEGTAKHWHWGRCVLAGDACHKLTPNSGLGFNNGVQDIVALCNSLHKIVVTAANRDPDSHVLSKAFQQYQIDRLSTIKKHTFVSTHLVRINSWENWAYFFIAKYIMASKRLEYIMLKYLVSRFIKEGMVLDYISVEEPFSAAVAWTHPTDHDQRTKVAKGLRIPRKVRALGTM
jgi:2-polyprenyl-6-methoxyphenol hydroxylase-like FAD-dependent oxidoreductase